MLVLAYHAVSASWPSALAVAPAMLERQLQLLRRRGYHGLTFAECERRRMAGTLPKRCVVITFDDGYHSTLMAKPILEAAGFPATVFVVTQFVESGAPLSWPGIDDWLDSDQAGELRPLSWEELRELSASGWEIGSHTLTHVRLPTLEDTLLAAELEDSREAIRRRVGACETIAYPYGLADRRVAGAALSAGYLSGCTLPRSHAVDEPHLRPRVSIYSKDRSLRFRAKISPASLALRRAKLIAATGSRAG
jgi:peptidoglycan/xylan/chitin deacetylase (PgdA/CDA1 family)